MPIITQVYKLKQIFAFFTPSLIQHVTAQIKPKEADLLEIG